MCLLTTIQVSKQLGRLMIHGKRKGQLVLVDIRPMHMF
jgi:hypothetical protein